MIAHAVPELPETINILLARTHSNDERKTKQEGNKNEFPHNTVYDFKQTHIRQFPSKLIKQTKTTAVIVENHVRRNFTEFEASKLKTTAGPHRPRIALRE